MFEQSPAVFVHGLLGSFYCGTVQAPLGSRLTYTPDLLGYGTCSEVPAAELTLRAQMEHLRADVLSRFNGRRVHLVAHSVGGIVANMLAHDCPDLIVSIVHLEGSFMLPHGPGFQLQRPCLITGQSLL